MFMIVQAVLCAVIAVLLAAGALSLYLDGAAKQAEGDLFYYMFTRERVGAKLLPILPLLCCAIGLTIAGVLLGIRDENAEKPARDEKLLRDLGSIRERAVHQQADQKTRILRTAVLAAALILIVIGIINGGLEDVLAKGAAICTECVGLG
jgi:energy-converting hydrogenase Eha subunit G